MKLLKNSTYQAMQNRIKMLEKDLEDQLNEFEKLVLLKNQMAKVIVEQDAKINLLEPKAEKWDAEVQRQRDKQKRRREKVKSTKK